MRKLIYLTITIREAMRMRIIIVLMLMERLVSSHHINPIHEISVYRYTDTHAR